MKHVFVVLSRLVFVFGIIKKLSTNIKLKENEKESQEAVLVVPYNVSNDCIEGHEGIVLEGELIGELLHRLIYMTS